MFALFVCSLFLGRLMSTVGKSSARQKVHALLNDEEDDESDSDVGDMHANHKYEPASLIITWFNALTNIISCSLLFVTYGDIFIVVTINIIVLYIFKFNIFSLYFCTCITVKIIQQRILQVDIFVTVLLISIAFELAFDDLTNVTQSVAFLMCPYIYFFLSFVILLFVIYYCFRAYKVITE